MDRSIEKTLSARAVELGRAGEPAGLPELLELLGKPSGQVRRLAVRSTRANVKRTQGKGAA